MALFAARLVKPLAEFNVTPDPPSRITAPAPVCINWQAKPMGKPDGTVTVTDVEEFIKNSLLLSAAATEKLDVLLASTIRPFEI